jgi:hypothetical protein
MDALDKAIAESEKPATTEDAAPDDTPKKPEEQPPEGGDPETKNMTPKAGAAFKAIKAEKKAAEKRAAELEARLTEIEKANTGSKEDAAESERLKTSLAEREAKIAEYEKELAVVAFEKTPEFRETVLQPMTAIIGVVERLSKKYSVPEKALMEVLNEKDVDLQGDLISELAGGFSERDRVSLYALADDFSAVLAQRDELRSRAAEALAARESLAAKKAAARTQEWKSTVEKVWGNMKTKVPMPEDQKTADDLIKQVSEMDFDSMSPDLKAFVAFSGGLIPVVVSQNKALQAQVADLTKSLEKYRSATPGASAGEARQQSRNLDSSVSFLDAIERRIAGQV